MPANFKTYEAQSRLVAALVAANPGMKLDFKAIARHYGSDTTAAAMEHRFRPIKEQARVLHTAVERDIDPKNIDIFSKLEIAKFYGESTPDGLQFQFRSIKKEAELLRKAVANGESPVAAFNKKGSGAGSTATTPAKTPAKTPRKKAEPRSGSWSGSAKRPRYKDDSESEEDVNYDSLDVTPTKPKSVKRTKKASNLNSEAPEMSGAIPAAAPTQTVIINSDDDFSVVETPSQSADIGAAAPSSSKQTDGGFSSQAFYHSFAAEEDIDTFTGNPFITYPGEFSSYEGIDGEV